MKIIKKTAAVYKLVKWYTKGDKNKEKLYTGIIKKNLYIENPSPSRPKIKIKCYYPSSKPLGAYILTPGLHPLGTDHPKMEDFSLMLCSLGYIVYSPHIQDYANLYIVKETLADYFAVFDALLDEPLLPAHNKGINIFSISFGCLLALRLASNKKRADKVSSVIIFGGFGSWRSTCDTVMDNIFTPKRPPADIRTVPVIYSHIIDSIPELESTESRNKIRKLWLSYTKKTWMDETYEDRENCLNLAHNMAKKLSGQEKITFLQGLGAQKDSYALYKKTIKNFSKEYLNPIHRAQEIKAAVYLIHGKEDELIPSEQQTIIKKALPPRVIRRSFLTNLYGHSDK